MAKHYLIADPRTGLVVRQETEQPTKASTFNLQVFQVNKATWGRHPPGSTLTLAPGPTLERWNGAIDWWHTIRATAADIMRSSR